MTTQEKIQYYLSKSTSNNISSQGQKNSTKYKTYNEESDNEIQKKIQYYLDKANEKETNIDAKKASDKISITENNNLSKNASIKNNGFAVPIESGNLIKNDLIKNNSIKSNSFIQPTKKVLPKLDNNIVDEQVNTKTSEELYKQYKQEFTQNEEEKGGLYNFFLGGNIFSENGFKEQSETWKQYEEALKREKESQVSNNSLSNTVSNVVTGINDFIPNVISNPKKALPTAGNALIETGKGIVDFSENVLDAGIQLGSSNLNPFMHLLYKGDVNEGQKIASDLIKEDISQKFIDETLGYGNTLANGKTVQQTIDDASLIRSDNLGGQIFRTVGSQIPSMMIGTGGVTQKIGNIASSAAFGTSAYGSALEEAYNNGATRDEANKYALMSAGVELITEKIYGGLGSALKTGAIDDVVAKTISSKISNKVVSKLTEMGIGAVFEGSEEVISDLVNPILKKLTYMSEEDIGKLYSDQNYLDSFVGGALSSLVIGSAQSISKNPGENMSSNTSESNDKAINNNQIKTSNVELNNETLNNQIIPSDKTLSVSNQSEFKYSNMLDTINNNRYAYLPSNDTKVNKMKSTATKYFNNSSETIAHLSNIEKIIKDKGYNVLFDDKITNDKGNTVNAQIKTLKNGEVEIRINPNSQRAGEFLLVHEITHAIETDRMKKMVLDYASKNVGFNESLETLKQTYGAEDVSSEVLADISGQLLGNQEFINNLSMKEPNTFKKIYNKIIELANKITGKSSEKLFIRDLKNKWEEAYRAQENNLNGNMYSQETLNDGTTYVKTENDLFNNSALLNKIKKEAPMSKSQGVLPYVDNISQSNENVKSDTSSTKYSMQESKNNTQELGNSSFNLKEKQLNIILKENPMLDDYHTGIRKVEDIKTLQETLQDSDYEGYDEFNPDLTRQDIENAIDSGKITVYSSYPIEQGIFISPSRMEAESYSGNGKIYSKKVSINDVAWIDPTQGQYAKVDTKYSQNNPTWQEHLENNYKSTGTITNYSDIVKQIEKISNDIKKQEQTNADTPDIEFYENKLEELKNVAIDNLNAENKGLLKSEINRVQSQIKSLNNESISNVPFSENNPDGLKYDPKTQKIINNDNKADKYVKPIKNEVKIDNIHDNKVEKQNITNAEYLKETSEKLYAEIANLKKGIKASNMLSSILEYNNDFAYVKQTLLNVKASPGKTVNAESSLEKMIRDIINTDYSNKTKLKEIFISEKPNLNESKILNNNESIKQLTKDKEESLNRLDSDIKAKRELYQTKKNKNTKLANIIQQQIISLENQKKSIASTYDHRIDILNTRNEKLLSKENQIKSVRTSKIQEYRDEAETLIISSIDQWKDKKMGLSYKTETMERNFQDIIPDKKIANEIINKYITPIKVANAKIQNFITSYNEKIKKLNINEKESIAIQMLGEGKYNGSKIIMDDKIAKDVINNSEYDSETKQNAHLYLDAIDYIENNKLNSSKIQKSVEKFRTIYDGLFRQINGVLKEQGYKEIEYRNNYFPHFTEEHAQGSVGKLMEKLGWKKQDTTVPTDIAGITDQFKPGKTWFKNAQRRYGNITEYNALKGFDNYVRGAADAIFLTESIQKLRALENEIRYLHSEKGIQDQYDKILESDIDSDQREIEFNQLFANASNPLPNLVTELRSYTDNIANKKSELDRRLEQAFNRQIYSTMTNVQGRLSANMVALNIGSALTNFIPITQAYAEIGTKNMARAMKESISNNIRDDGFTEKSTFLTNRNKQADRLFNTKLDKLSKKTSFVFEAVDSLTSNIIVRGKYYENIQKGMSESEAIKNADSFANSVMAGRSKGDMPTIFNAKNPFIKLFTSFQLEVNNQYRYMFKDLPRNIGDDNKKKLAMAFLKMFLGAWVYNKFSQAVTGRKAAFSPIDTIQEITSTVSNKKISNFDKLKNSAKTVTEDIPFVGGLVGGGRLPISSGLPDIKTTTESIVNLFDDEKRGSAWKSLTKELSKPAFYIAPPFGGGQVKKTIEGLSMYSNDLPGSYTTSGKLRYTAKTDPLSVAQAAVFGQYPSEEARDYFDNGYSALTEKQTEQFKELDIPIETYRDYLSAVKDLNKITSDKNSDGKAIPGTASAKKAYEIINNDDYDETKKKFLIGELSESEDKVTLGDLEKLDNDIDVYKYYYSLSNSNSKNKFLTLTNNFNIDQKTYSLADSGINTIEKKYKEKLEKCLYGGEKLRLYKEYISKSKKQEIVNYINGLNVSETQKIILFKTLGNYSISYYKNAMYKQVNNLNLSVSDKKNIWSYLYGDS